MPLQHVNDVGTYAAYRQFYYAAQEGGYYFAYTLPPHGVWDAINISGANDEIRTISFYCKRGCISLDTLMREYGKPTSALLSNYGVFYFWREHNISARTTARRNRISAFNPYVMLNGVTFGVRNIH